MVGGGVKGRHVVFGPLTAGLMHVISLASFS